MLHSTVLLREARPILFERPPFRTNALCFPFFASEVVKVLDVMPTMPKMGKSASG